MFSSTTSPDTKIGEKFLQPEVISQWDWKDYLGLYTYFDEHIKLVVNICVKTDDKTIECEHLKKDLSNINFKKK